MDNEKLGQQILAELKLSVTESTFNTFFRQTSLLSLADNIATISCPNPYVRELLEKRYYSLLKAIVDRLTKVNTSLIFTSQKAAPPEKKEEKTRGLGPLFEDKSPGLEEKARKAHLRADFIFANFAVSSCNELAYAAACAVAKSPGKAYNPLFIYGGVGVGKTHLMQGIGHEVLEKKSQAKIIYCMGEEFTNEIIEAIKQRATGRFKDKYRNAELLLVDDIQFLSGKETAQEEFFHTFNVIQREGGQIVVTSDRPPTEIKRIEDRLRSRFEGGLTVDVQPPDFELRCAILKIKAGQRETIISDEVIRILAGNFTNTRALEGALSRLLTICELKKIPIDPEIAYEVAGKKEERQEPLLKIAPKEIFEAVAGYFSLKTLALRSQTREQKIALPRQVLMYLLRTEAKMPLTEIANFLNRKDHTTIIHGVRKITGLLSTSEIIRENVDNIRKKLRG